LRAPVSAIIGPLSAFLTILLLIIMLPNVMLTLHAMPPSSMLFLSTMLTTQFVCAYALGGLMGQPSEIRMSMGLESGLRDVPLAAALILTCFDGLPATIVTPAVSVVYILGFSIMIPASFVVLLRTCRMWVYAHLHSDWSSSTGSPSIEKPELLGLRWRDVGMMRPLEGREVKNVERLSHVLPFRAEFTPTEWAGFGINDLQENDYVHAGETFFVLEIPTEEELPAKRSSTLGMLFPRIAVCGIGFSGRRRGKRQMGTALT